jgi:hypothetical protein
VATKVTISKMAMGNVWTINEKGLQVGMRIMAVGDLSCHVVSLAGCQLRDWNGRVNNALVNSNNARTCHYSVGLM